MEKEHLAIASVPCQTWGAPYDAETSLIKGTIFPELNKPFFKVDSMEDRPAGTDRQDGGRDGKQVEREKLLKQIDEVSFVVNDLTLYLDTHEEDKEALQLFTETNADREQLMTQYAEKFYPLTQNCMAKCGRLETKFSWTDGPMPWEGACI